VYSVKESDALVPIERKVPPQPCTIKVCTDYSRPHLRRAAVFHQIDLKSEPHGALIVAVSVHYGILTAHRRAARGNDEVQSFSLRFTEYQ
jgi:hypothetical protein